MKSDKINKLEDGTCATTASAVTNIILSDADRLIFARMIDRIKSAQDAETSDKLVDEVAARLTNMPGSDSADALRPLIKCLPPSVAARLPEILEAEGSPAKTAVLSFVGKDIMFRLETAVSYGDAFLALMDLECDIARQIPRS